VRHLWRGLAGFWAILVLTGAGGAGVLQFLGPPRLAVSVAETVVPPQVQAAVSHRAELAKAPEAVASLHAAPPPPPPHVSSSAPAQQKADGRQASLLEPSALYPNGQLPRIAADGRTARQAYAASFDTSDTRPRVAILLAGIGMNEAESMAALALPSEVSLAVTPYATRLERLVPAARAAGHELLLSVPMEPQGFPLNDPGRRALLTGASAAANAQLLEWAMTRFTSYVGVTGALGHMRGERFAAALDQMKQFKDTLADRGLLYVDPRPNVVWTRQQAGQLPARGIDVVLDDPEGGAEIDKALASLVSVARNRGSAMGLAGRPSPVAVDRIAVWAAGLAAGGIALAPISVVVQMPQVSTPPLTLSQRTVPPP
jgi:polysaccharide deacetylase 2 family uncharacterized protein YibQ